MSLESFRERKDGQRKSAVSMAESTGGSDRIEWSDCEVKWLN